MVESPGTALLGAAELRRIAEELGMRPSKKLGQNFVHDANTVRRIVQLAGVGPAETVLEVGPGLGSLTLGLLEAGSRVAGVEVDALLAERLSRTVSEQAPDWSARLRVHHADALRLTPADLAWEPSALVANLPYNVAVPVVLHLLEALPGIRHGLVMVQAEVADRMAAGAGSRSYGVPSVKLAYYGTVQRVGSVPRSVFWPVPNVDSALVEFRRHDVPCDADAASFFDVVDAAFAQRRKTLRAALSRWAGSAPDAEALLRAANLNPSARAEQLTPDDFTHLARVCSP